MAEANFDGLVGPTHNYAGLSHGNVASAKNQGDVSRPRQAALQGLAKMEHLYEFGLVQGVLPPHERPHVPTLRALGFTGSDAEVFAKAAQHPRLLAACCSASAMWTANAATVSPSADTKDHRVHFTPANLSSKFHRAIEPAQTARALKRVFVGERFVHHAPLPACLGDEGAANHTRLVGDDESRGVELFVYGRDAFGLSPTKRFAARQAREASEAIARAHLLDPARVVFAQQSSDAIDAGVFHNDVIAVGHRDALLFHEDAFADRALIDRLRAACGFELQLLKVGRDELSVDEAITSYLFNSQLITGPGGLTLVGPEECNAGRPKETISRFFGESLLGEARFLNLRESMRNGGGPACLRLRVELTEDEFYDVNQGCLVDLPKLEELRAWVNNHYREALKPSDLADPHLLNETRAALDELTQILNLGSDFYEFQR